MVEEKKYYSLHRKDDSINYKITLDSAEKSSANGLNIDTNKTCVFNIVDSDFSNDIIDVTGISKKGLAALCKKPFKTKQLIVESEVDKGVNDTLYSILSEKSKIILYNFSDKAVGRIPTWKFAEINNDVFILKHGIHVGMSKNKFLSHFQAKSTKCDTIQITDDEQMSLNIFIFKQDKLKKIELNSGDE